MSKRNSPEAKRAARERLRAERERDHKRARTRRQLIVAASVVAVLGAAAGVGFAAAGLGGDEDNTDWSAVRAQLEAGGAGASAEPGTAFPTEAPSGASGPDGTTIRVGEEDAAHTLTLYEDPRCPACASFEQRTGAEIRQGLENGTYAVEYVFGTFLDDGLGGSGSKNALNALGAALDVSPEAFLDFHDALYSAEFHPPESDDAFADDERLIEIARSVPALADNEEFAEDVRESTFALWALRMSDAFDAAPGVDSTPTLKFDDELLEGVPATPEQFQALIDERTG